MSNATALKSYKYLKYLQEKGSVGRDSGNNCLKKIIFFLNRPFPICNHEFVSWNNASIRNASINSVRSAVHGYKTLLFQRNTTAQKQCFWQDTYSLSGLYDSPPAHTHPTRTKNHIKSRTTKDIASLNYVQTAHDSYRFLGFLLKKHAQVLSYSLFSTSIKI